MFYLLITALIWGGDSVVKRKVEESSLGKKTRSICGGRLLLQKVHNEGAILGIFEDKPEVVKNISLGMMAVIAVIYLNLLQEKGKAVLKIAFALTAGGAASNVTDRVRNHYVVDYFSIQTKWKRLRRIVFNLSDLCIMVGLTLFVIQKSK